MRSCCYSNFRLKTYLTFNTFVHFCSKLTSTTIISIAITLSASYTLIINAQSPRPPIKWVWPSLVLLLLVVWGWGSDGPNMYICNVAWQNFKGRLLGVSMFLPFSKSSSQLLCDKWFNQLGINQRLPVSLSLPLGNSCREESFHIYDTFYLPPQQLSDLWWLCASTLCFLFAFMFYTLNIVSHCFVFSLIFVFELTTSRIMVIVCLLDCHGHMRRLQNTCIPFFRFEGF